MCTYLGACVELTAADVDAGDHREAARSSTSRAICSTPRRRGGPSPRPRAWRAASGRHDRPDPVGRLRGRPPPRTPCWASSTPRSTSCSPTRSRSCALFETDDFEAATRGHRAGACEDRRRHARRQGLGGAGRRPSTRRSPAVSGRESRGHHRRGRPVRGRVPVRPRRAAARWTICGRLGSLAAAEVIGHYGPRPAVSLRTWRAASGL